MFIRLEEKDEQLVEDTLVRLRRDPNVLRMKQYVQHGHVSTYEHCENVVRASCWLSRRLPGNASLDYRSLIIGAFLHDFYLYDWHDKNSHCGLHGFHHARKAKKNAIDHFHINKKTQRIIECHMWPLTIRRIPTSREAWIVTLADKYCSSCETLFHRG